MEHPGFLSRAGEWFTPGWMKYLQGWMKQEGWMKGEWHFLPNFLYPLITWFVLFFTKNISAIVNKMINFKRSNLRLSSQQFITSEKTYYGANNYVHYVMGINFSERRRVLFNRMVESLLCYLHERPVPKLSARSARIAVLPKVSNTGTLIRVTLSVELQA